MTKTEITQQSALLLIHCMTVVVLIDGWVIGFIALVGYLRMCSLFDEAWVAILAIGIGVAVLVPLWLADAYHDSRRALLGLESHDE